MQHVQVLLRQEKGIFVTFKKITFRNNRYSRPKKLVSNLDGGPFLARRLFRIDFENKFSIQKLFLKVWEIFWYKLEHRMTRTSDFTSGESHFCRIFKMRMADGAMSKISY